MIWVVWFILALEILVIAIGLRIMLAMVWEAARAPADPSSVVGYPPERSRARPLALQRPEAGDEASSLGGNEEPSAPFALEEADERGYASTRRLHMRCEAAVCRTPFGARIVAGRYSLKEPQYAWDYAGVGLAEKALVCAEFSTHPEEGVVQVEDLGRGCCPAAEPQEYFRRWRYTPKGRMERF